MSKTAPVSKSHGVPGIAAGADRRYLLRMAGGSLLICILISVYWIATSLHLGIGAVLHGPPPWVLAGGLIVFVLAVTPAMVRRSPIFATYFFLLFIYTIFFQIGYAYYPRAVIWSGMYFGERALLHYQIFVFLSLLAIAATFMLLARKLFRVGRYEVRQEWGAPGLVVIFSLGLGAAVLWGTYSFYDKMGYSLQDQMGNKWLGLGYQELLGVILVLYCSIRTTPALKVRRPRKAALAALALCLIPFAIVTWHVRLRLEAAALVLGITAFEVSPYLRDIWRVRRKLGKWLLLLVLCIAMLQALARYRHTSVNSESLGERITNQDYSPPSYVLMAAIAKDWVHPFEVLRSIAGNTLPFMGVPYIQEDIAHDAWTRFEYSRNRGSAFYALAEGYVIFRNAGFFYNAVIVVFGIALWGLFASSDNALFNRFGTALVCSHLFDVVRGQSSYFIRSDYVFLLPAMVLFALSTGLIPNLFRLKTAFRPRPTGRALHKATV